MRVYVKAFFSENFGDDIFIKILTERYKNHKFYGISKGFKKYKNCYSNLKVWSNSYIFRIIRKFKLEKYLARRCDISLTIGGSMFMEESQNDKNKEFNLRKDNNYIIGCNFGPYDTKEYFENVKSAFQNAEDVCFREDYSYKMFKDIKSVRKACDIAFLLNTKNIKITNRKRVVFSVVLCERKAKKCTRIDYENKLIELIKYFINKDYEIVLMSFCKAEQDEEAIQSLLSHCDDNLKSKIDTYFYNGNVEEALNVLGDSEIIVGTRLHANILGMILGKTILPIAYSSKTINILEDMGYTGKIIDMNKIQEFQVNQLDDNDLKYKLDVSFQKKDADRQFEKLDKVLGVEV